MKGVDDYYGEKLEFLLINSGGHDERSVERANERVETYGMQDYKRVRFNGEEFDTQVAAAFGHFGYGQIVIDGAGILRAIDVRERELETLLASACGGDGKDLGLDGFGVSARVARQSGGGLFNLSGVLSSDLTADVIVSLELPEGWHVGSDLEGVMDPTSISVTYAGKDVSLATPITPSSGEDSAPTPTWAGPVKIVLPLSMKKGTAIGRYFIHGKLKFLACNEDGCLPVVEVPWSVVVRAI